MASCIYTILALLVAFQSEQRVAQAACNSPAEAETTAKMCLTSVGFNMDAAAAGGSMGTAGDLSQLKGYCRDKAFDGALQCVQDILDECTAGEGNSQVMDTLNTMISIPKLRSAFNYMCENIDVLEENAQCISQQGQPVAACVQTETKKMQTEMKAKQSSGQMTQDDIKSLTCGFMSRLIGCQQNVYETACGKKVADFLLSFSQAITPPMCADYNGARSLVINSTCIFSALFIAILLHFKL